VTVLVHVKLSTHGRKSITEFEDRVRKLPEVTHCFTTMGAIDFMLIVVTADIRAYERFLREHLAQLPGIHAIESHIALTTVKDSTALPLGAAQLSD
jgi:Lrp/AsnC family transcriptional regulator